MLARKLSTHVGTIGCLNRQFFYQRRASIRPSLPAKNKGNSWGAHQKGPKMAANLIKRWEREFRAAARADKLALFREHLENLSASKYVEPALRDNEAELLLEGTVNIVQMSAVYLSMDGRRKDLKLFLEMQKYNPAESRNAEYVVTFNLGRQVLGRVLVDAEMRLIDLADLYGCFWLKFDTRGYGEFWVSRPDKHELTGHQVGQIEELVTDDLRFDYGEDEVGFWFEENGSGTVLYCHVFEDNEIDRDSNEQEAFDE